MGLSGHLLGLAAAACLFGAPSPADGRRGDGVGKRQNPTAKYCPEGTTVCFSEYTVPAGDVTFRFAIPDVASAPFDVLLQVVAPVSVKWAGLAWGGSMTKDPLLVGWPNGNSTMVSSRWATAHSIPQAYTGATYIPLPTSYTNATHWHLDALCTGCSMWSSSSGSLNPNGTNSFAWAKSSSRAVANPASNTSSFGLHDMTGNFSHDLRAAKIPQGVFDALKYDLTNGGSGSGSGSSGGGGGAAAVGSATKPAGSATAGVVTGVTTLSPMPSSSRRTTSFDQPLTPSVSTSVCVVTPMPSPPPGVTYTLIPPWDQCRSQSSQVGKPPVSSSQATVVTIIITQTATPPTVTPKPVGGGDGDGDGDDGATWGPPFGAGGPPFGKGRGKGKGPPFRPPVATPSLV